MTAPSARTRSKHSLPLWVQGFEGLSGHPCTH